MDDKKIRYNLTCPTCFRIYKDFVPLMDKESVAVIWCNACGIVIGRFDWGTESYSEDNKE